MLRALVLFPVVIASIAAVDLDHAGSGAALAAHNRTALLELLHRHTAPLLIGQNIGQADAAETGYGTYIAALGEGPARRIPILVGIDYGWDRIEAASIRRANAVLIAHWRRGGLVQVSMHLRNPSTQQGVRSVQGLDIEAVLRPGSMANARWLADLDTIATGLAELRAAGVAVLWRPLHEANGTWFWWGGTALSSAQYRRLWHQTFRHLTTVHGLDHLLWIYCPNAPTGEEIAPPTAGYPGDAVVDAVAMDIYLDELGPGALNIRGGLDALLALGKPFGIGEIGPGRGRRGEFDAVACAAAIRAHCPQARWCLWWHSWTEGVLGQKQRLALIDNPGAQPLLTDPAHASLPWQGSIP